jgi:DNA repair protein RadC
MDVDCSVPVYRIALVRERTHNVVTKRISQPEEAADLFRSYMADPDRELFAVMVLSAKNEVIGIHTVSIGTLDSTIVHPRETFKPAVLLNAASIIVAHNHPSGDPTPSFEDREMTKRLVDAGEILGIPVLDHLVITQDAFTSLRVVGTL